MEPEPKFNQREGSVFFFSFYVRKRLFASACASTPLQQRSSTARRTRRSLKNSSHWSTCCYTPAGWYPGGQQHVCENKFSLIFTQLVFITGLCTSSRSLRVLEWIGSISTWAIYTREVKTSLPFWFWKQNRFPPRR